jgi:hypothetical protein
MRDHDRRYLLGRKAVIIYGFDYSNLPMDPTIEAFEILASRYVSLGPRIVAAYCDLVRPVILSARIRLGNRHAYETDRWRIVCQ